MTTPPLEVIDIPLQQLCLAEPGDDSRKDIGDIGELAASIRSVGLLQPIGVRVLADSHYRVIFGHRRLAAVSSLGWRSVPAVVIDAEPSEDLLRALVENIQRRALSRQERALALEQLLASGLTGRQIAERTGMRENVVYSWLRVARSKPLMVALNDGRLGIHEARVLASLPAATIAALLPELQGQPEQFRLARIQRAIDDARKTPPRGFYKANVENRTKRLLVQIAELMRGVREVRSAEELRLVQDIVGIAARWKRDLQRATADTLPP
jgi:ParB family transcriptional regulator, chromosome partitioning protein